MICIANSDDLQWGYRNRSRDRQAERPERFRMARVKRGPSTNVNRRRKRQPMIDGACRRRNKKMR